MLKAELDAPPSLLDTAPPERVLPTAEELADVYSYGHLSHLSQIAGSLGEHELYRLLLEAKKSHQRQELLRALNRDMVRATRAAHVEAEAEKRRWMEVAKQQLAATPVYSGLDRAMLMGQLVQGPAADAVLSAAQSAGPSE